MCQLSDNQLPEGGSGAMSRNVVHIKELIDNEQSPL
jgi:hypothetical protein